MKARVPSMKIRERRAIARQTMKLMLIAEHNAHGHCKERLYRTMQCAAHIAKKLDDDPDMLLVLDKDLHDIGIEFEQLEEFKF